MKNEEHILDIFGESDGVIDFTYRDKTSFQLSQI